MQVSPGVYRPSALEALDFVVAEAGRLGLQLILSLTSNWLYYNGADQYVDWSAALPNTSLPRRTQPPPTGQRWRVGDLKPGVR